MSLSLSNLSARQLRQAAAIKERIDSLQDELNRLVGMPAAASVRRGGRRKMSRAAIARIRAGVRARWAKIKRKGGAAKASRKTKRRMSAAVKARLSAIARERWRKVKASGRKAL